MSAPHFRASTGGMFSAEALQVTADNLGRLVLRAMQLLRSVSVEAQGEVSRISKCLDGFGAAEKRDEHQMPMRCPNQWDVQDLKICVKNDLSR